MHRGVNFICQLCYKDTYLLRKPEPLEELACQPCPLDKARCLGGNKIGPVRGFWRKSGVTPKFIPCKYERACLGLFLDEDETTYSPTGNCDVGYYGALCASCIPGYNKKDRYLCHKCG